ncbi:MAG: hypothetical protein JSV12_02645 [Candidatus Bathyarchaeota archaeon]|nr:MAG: hypothetical protein JSV12_02645 [Candidatus Bathyarchaeota archaeon]
MKCKVCEREAENEYCELHEKAHRNILREYGVWKKASDVSWKQYLIEVAKNPHTGVWAKEVAESLISETK